MTFITSLSWIPPSIVVCVFYSMFFVNRTSWWVSDFVEVVSHCHIAIEDSIIVSDAFNFTHISRLNSILFLFIPIIHRSRLCKVFKQTIAITPTFYLQNWWYSCMCKSYPQLWHCVHFLIKFCYRFFPSLITKLFRWHPLAKEDKYLCWCKRKLQYSSIIIIV